MNSPEVIFTHWIEPEDMPFEGNVQASDDDAADREQEQWVEAQLESGNQAAWCYAIVEATTEVFVDEESLSEGGVVFKGRTAIGGMSYPSEHRLWHDTLAEMKREALFDLFVNMRSAAKKNHANIHDAILVTLDALLEKYDR